MEPRFHRSQSGVSSDDEESVVPLYASIAQIVHDDQQSKESPADLLGDIQAIIQKKATTWCQLPIVRAGVRSGYGPLLAKKVVRNQRDNATNESSFPQQPLLTTTTPSDVLRGTHHDEAHQTFKATDGQTQQPRPLSPVPSVYTDGSTLRRLTSSTETLQSVLCAGGGRSGSQSAPLATAILLQPPVQQPEYEGRKGGEQQLSPPLCFKAPHGAVSQRRASNVVTSPSFSPLSHSQIHSSQRLSRLYSQRVRGNRITASRDHWVVDSETAAALNFQNRDDRDSDEEQESVSDHMSQKSNQEAELGHLLDVACNHDDVTNCVPSTLYARQTSTEFLRRRSSTSPRHGPNFSSRKSLYGRRASYNTASSRKQLESSVDSCSVGSPRFSTIASEEPPDASHLWQRLAQSVRRRGLLNSSKSAYVSRPSGHTQNLDKQLLLQGLLKEQKDKYGKYVQWSPSVVLPVNSCADPDLVEAVRMITAVLTLRDTFTRDFEETPSMCIFPPCPIRPPGEGSNEPIFDVFRVEPLPPCNAEYRMENGVFQVYWNPDPGQFPPTNFDEKFGGGAIPWYNGQPLLAWKNPVPTVGQLLSSLKDLMNATQHPGCKTFAFRRLAYLRNRFAMHLMFNSSAELQEVKENTHRDFYNVRKVDTHVHHSACMHQKHLLRFIRKKYRTEPDQVVARSRDGTPVTLRCIFDTEVGISAWDASIDLLNVHALGSCFHRFDIFNSKYNPFGQALLREVFLKTDNMIQGRYLAEITKEVVADLEDGKYQFVEWRVSIYGKARDEWKKLSKWIHSNRLSSKQVRWMVQVPRLYHVYRKLNLIKSFGDLLSNIFEPLFEAVRDPVGNPEIFHFLLQMNGWDSVDDESVVSKYTSEGGALPLPEQWTEATNPPYSYWAYYMYANIRSLNELLVARGLRHLPFRPHCGEAGSISHLASMYLLADGINHGIMLRKTPLLQYLYYLRQIGLAVSPLSNNALFHPITKNPFYDYFSIGLNVSLSSDDPLMFHFTDEPLLEEYSCCAHVWRMSPVDLCEIARNSVLQSHFEPQLKKHWLGSTYKLPGKQGNDIRQTNVSNIRVQYRSDTLIEELRYLRDVLHIDHILDRILLTASKHYDELSV